MRIRVTTTTPGYTSLITKELARSSHGNLKDFPWCYKGNVEGDWRTAGEDKWAAAAEKAPTSEVVMDCEGAYPYVDAADGVLKWSNASTGSYIFDRQGTLTFLRLWASRLAAVRKATGKSVYGYPCYPGPQGLDVSDPQKWPDKRNREPENVAFLMTEKALCGGHYSGPMIEAYIWADMVDFYEKVDAQIARCASVGLTPKIVLISAFYIRNQMDGPAASFVGPKLILEQARAVRDLGLEAAFFNPNHPPALEAIARAAVDL